ncbi:MAG: methylmalonyl-CoA mutase family protein, partial [Spirosomataceae bacterium]
MLQISEFENKTKKNWEAQATIDLKGENPFETLTWLSEESIDWKPIYTPEDIQDIPTHEISLAQKSVNELDRELIETIYVSDNQPETIHLANLKALEYRTKGVNSFIFELAPFTFSTLQLQKLTQGIKTSEIPVYWRTVESKDIYVKQKAFSPYLLKGGVLEPLVFLTEEGNWQANDKAISQLLRQTEQDTTYKVIHACTSPFTLAGGNAVQELAYFCSQWVDLLDKLTGLGHSLEEIIGKTLFETSLTTNYFLDIAKIRAFRYLLNKIHTSFDPNVNTVSSYIMGGLSNYYISPFASHTNMLRATSATMSGLTGGLDAVHIPTWDKTKNHTSTNELAQRVALNTFHVIQEEALLAASKDPSEGSYFIESLTFQLIQKAWDLFLLNETQGGFWKIYATGEIEASLLGAHINRINQKNKILKNKKKKKKKN